LITDEEVTQDKVNCQVGTKENCTKALPPVTMVYAVVIHQHCVSDNCSGFVVWRMTLKKTFNAKSNNKECVEDTVKIADIKPLISRL
jgi:hypothetical protein